MTVKEIYPAMRLCFRALVFVSVAFLSSCDEDITEERDPCDFVRSVDEVLLDSNGSTFQESFFKFSFQGRLYDFRDNRFRNLAQCNEAACFVNYSNDFFEFKVKRLERNLYLFQSLNKIRPLLTPDSLNLTITNLFQPSFLLKDRCGGQYPVAQNTNIFFPDVSSNTITNIQVWGSQIIDDEVNPRYSSSYFISGTFSTRILIGDKAESIGGSYTLFFSVVEPL